MSVTVVPKNYKSCLTIYETQRAIGLVKRTFEDNLSAALHLKRVSAPLFVAPETGLNDDLNGVERAVNFDILETKTQAHIVHSLAKWKRMALYKYDFHVGNGLYTDMNAIRRDEEMSNIHSIYVDQWDWEKVIEKKDRHLDYLKQTVQTIVDALCDTLEAVKKVFPQINVELSRDISFITTQELEDLYPDMTAKERENLYVKSHKTTFIMQIGDELKSGKKHDGRAPDYDDWSLNGDILFWNDVLQNAIEISSMGIRVDAQSLDRQLAKSGCNERREMLFHSMLLENKLPLTIGGGIGQSRTCQLLLGKAHIGEVQVSIWDQDTMDQCKAADIILL